MKTKLFSFLSAGLIVAGLILPALSVQAKDTPECEWIKKKYPTRDKWLAAAKADQEVARRGYDCKW